jgi:hypothetical protein
MDLINKIKQSYQEAHDDKKIILNEIHNKLKNANYYETKFLKESELFINIEYPIQIVSRVMSMDYWHIDKKF